MPAREELARPREREETWTPWVNLALGAWLVATPAALGTGHFPTAVSDVASGLVIILLATLTIRDHDRGWARWGATLVGLWLLTAPLVFHATVTPATYLNDTLVGVLVITFSTVVPGMPRLTRGTVVPARGQDVPHGWSYNPSSWSQRLQPVALAVIGFLVARYLTAYQLGHIDSAWDPFFGAGTERVLDSSISKAFPVPDAGLGAVGYLLDALAGIMAGTSRWRTHPWIVLLFGVFIIPFGVVSITLVILQPVAVGAWCTLCLATAVISLAMIPLAVDEVVASGQFLWRVHERGRSVWRALWAGDVIEEEHSSTRGTGGGLSFPAPLVASALLGVGLMAAPALLGTTGALATSHHLVGPLVVTFAVIAFSEPARAARWVNVPAGAWVAVAPFVLSGASYFDYWIMPALGVAIAILALPRGKVTARYGPWQRFVV